MGRRDHLMRIALCASQRQIQEPVTPSEADDDQDDVELPEVRKFRKVQRLDMAQEAVLGAIGFMSDVETLKKSAEGNKDAFSVATLCGLVNYHLPLVLSSQRNQILVHTYPSLPITLTADVSSV